MSRVCAMCRHPKRQEIERRVLRGESNRLVSLDLPFGESAVARHMRAHVLPGFKSAALRGVDLHVSTFASRLAELADETRAVRLHAHAADDPRLLLSAIGSERDTLGLMLNRLGIDSEEVIDTVREAHALLAALGAVLDEPTTRALSDHLGQRGESELADAFSAHADRIAAHELEKSNGAREISA